MANQGLKPNAKNISYELGIINAYININPFSSNLILDINLLQTIEYYPFSFRLFYNHLYKNQEFEYGYKGYNGIRDFKLNNYNLTNFNLTNYHFDSIDSIVNMYGNILDW